jgi:hypothetical protein
MFTIFRVIHGELHAAFLHIRANGSILAARTVVLVRSSAEFPKEKVPEHRG